MISETAEKHHAILSALRWKVHESFSQSSDRQRRTARELTTLLIKELEFADVGFRRRRENVQSDARGCDRRKAIDLLVTDGVSFGDGHPPVPLPGFDAIVLDMLAVVQPFHGEA